MPKSNDHPRRDPRGTPKSPKGDRKDVEALLNAAPTIERVAAVARVALAQRDGSATCPRYFGALDKALLEEPPIFAGKAYADTYRAASANGQWLAISLMTASEREGDGAQRLWSLAACSVNEEEHQLLKRHACDESSHALAYLALLDITFPGAVDPSFRSEMNQLSPHYSMGQTVSAVPGSPYARIPTVDDYIQMNIAEIRTTIHHFMQRPALAVHCSPDNLRRATKVLDSVLRDELSHIAYSAMLIERKSEDMDATEFQALFCKRVRDFNRITSKEVGELIFD
jgi:hypothetical protein